MTPVQTGEAAGLVMATLVLAFECCVGSKVAWGGGCCGCLKAEDPCKGPTQAPLSSPEMKLPTTSRYPAPKLGKGFIFKKNYFRKVFYPDTTKMLKTRVFLKQGGPDLTRKLLVPEVQPR